MTKKTTEQQLTVEQQECFIIMPISDPETHEKGHFKLIYDNIFKVACKNAGFKAHRADDEKSTGVIHTNILKKILNAPIAICDLSTLNPNVTFELGIRQAFDMPVVLVQEKGTRHIFDLAPIKTIEYCKEMKYHDVIAFQESLSEALTATMAESKKPDNSNSIVKFLSLKSAAKLPNVEGNESNMNMNLIQSELRDMKKLISGSINYNETTKMSPLNFTNFKENNISRINSMMKATFALFKEGVISPMKYEEDLYKLLFDIKQARNECTSLSEAKDLENSYAKINHLLEQHKEKK
jgi:hypothetical protein